MRANLLIAGIINLLVGAGWIVGGTIENNVTLAIGSFIIVSGIIFILYSRLKIEEVAEKKNTILTLAIFLYPINLISAIVLSIEYDLIKRDYANYKRYNNISDSNDNVQNVQQPVTKEAKKVDGMLKIGIAMVSVAGIMIVTTSWASITDVIKLVLLVVIGTLFFGLSMFSDFKLKIRNTSIAYWVLSMVSFGLGIFLVGYSKMAGSWFSFDGEGENVFIAVLMGVIAVMTYVTYKRFSINSFLYTSYIAVTVALLCVLRQLGQEPVICVMILAIILLVINLLPKTEKQSLKIIKNFSLVTTYILTAFVLTELKDVADNLLVFVNFLIQVASLIALGIREKSDIVKILSSLAVVALTSVAVTYLLVDLKDVYKLLVTRSIYILMGILICAIIIREHKLNNLFLSIGLPIVLASVVFHVDIAVAVFVGCIALIMIIFGAIKKEYKAVYVEGIVFTIINLVVQLNDLWGKIPFSIYLLIGGLVLIGIVTVRELKKTNRNERSTDVVNSDDLDVDNDMDENADEYDDNDEQDDQDIEIVDSNKIPNAVEVKNIQNDEK